MQAGDMSHALFTRRTTRSYLVAAMVPSKRGVCQYVFDLVVSSRALLLNLVLHFTDP
jgi:hypothetical protein